MHKLIDQFHFDENDTGTHEPSTLDVSEDRATLLYLIDNFNKNLFEMENHSVRQVRAQLDEFAMELLKPGNVNVDKTLFRFRQFFSRYRIDEYTYVQKTFDEFRSILWDFVDQLSEDLTQERAEDKEVQVHLNQLKDAVESDSIDLLKTQSREFIDSYVEYQSNKDTRRTDRMESIRTNLHTVKKKLTEANESMRLDHLTSAYNRKSFDEQMKRNWKFSNLSGTPVSLIIMDIDHFKNVNDTYGHAVGDFVLKECVQILKSCFPRDTDFVARIGGEEFAVILPDYQIEHAIKKAEETLQKVASSVIVQDGHEIRYTISMGIAQFNGTESIDEWFKRTDAALYYSKENGRNRYTVSTDSEGNEAA